MSTVPQTMDEVIDTLTGHDEMAIGQHFGQTISDLMGDKTMLGRAMVFVLARRADKNDDDARNAALAMPLKEIFDYFAAESAESGKDEQANEPPPETSLVSVS